MIKVYHYDHETGVYAGTSFEPNDPVTNPERLMDGDWLIPAFATTMAPPAEKEGNARVFRYGHWGYVPIDAPTDENPSEEPHEPTIEIVRDISDRQFFQLLAIKGIITEDEALDAVGPGIIPPAMTALIEQLPENLRFDAKMKVRGATTFVYDSSVAVLIQHLYGWTDEERKQFWIDAILL